MGTKSAGTPNPYGVVWLALAAYVVYRIVWWSYKIRLQAIEEYGPVIHEFDPYFNYRATEVSLVAVFII
jgi:asparagine N-glycosylation enzyme membrane subunit Stt3